MELEKPLKILLVADQFFAANNGMTISSRRFAQVLRAHGHEVRVMCFGTPDLVPEGQVAYLMKKQYIPIFDKLVSAQGMTFAKPDKPKVEEAVRWADVIHFLTPFALSHRAVLLARKLGKPYTAAFHVQPENISSSIHLGKVAFVNNGIYHWFHHYFYRYCDHIHCPSNFIAGELRRTGYGGELHVISNGIDPDFSYRKVEKTQEFAGKFLVLMVGRLSIEKRQDVLVRAVAASRHKEEIHLVLAGKGPRVRQIQNLARKLGVRMTNRFFPKPALLDLIGMADLYVHAADMEIEAMSCMEAFACGRVPVIANSPKSATPQFALDARSLFRAGDSADLAAKIDYWMEHPEERQEMEVRYADLAGRYALDTCVTQAEAMFRQAIREKAGEHHGQ